MEKRDVGLDTAKAIGSVFVLMLHLQPIQSTDQTVKTLMSFLWNHVFIVAVPVFYLVSLSILFEKVTKPYYLRNRICRLLDILAFWCSFKVVFYIWNTRLPIADITLELSVNVLKDSIYYFIFDLIFLSILSYFWLKLSEKLRIKLSLFLVITFSIYFASVGNIRLQGLDNFLIYIPLAELLRKQKELNKLKVVSFSVWLLFTFLELFVLQTPFSVYARISVAAGALFVYLSCKNLQPGILKPFAEYSLGVYAIHLYFQTILIKILPPADSYFYGFNLLSLLVFFSTIFLTFTTVRILEKTPLRKYVR